MKVESFTLFVVFFIIDFFFLLPLVTMQNVQPNIHAWLKLDDLSQLLLTRYQQGNLELLKQFEVSEQQPCVWDSFRFVKAEGLDWQKLCQYQDWLIFTSARSAQFFFEDVDLSWLKGIRVACVGPVTAECVQSFGVKVDLIAKVQSSKGLSQETIFQNSNSLRILHLQPEDGRQEFVNALQSKHKIKNVIHYRKEFFPLPPDVLEKLKQKQITTVLFYSPSVVQFFYDTVLPVPGLFQSLAYAVIGQSTKDAVERLGGKVQFFPHSQKPSGEFLTNQL